MMGQNSSEAMQVIYMEVEGIKLAIQMTKDAVKFACQMMKYLICSLKNSPYKKVMGKTNKKNMKARANGQPLVSFTMDKRAYQMFKKMAAKYGILYYAFTPLHSGKVNSMQLMFTRCDLPMAQALLKQIKENLIREDVKNGMDEETSRQNIEDNNRMESMEEFAENTGVLVPKDVFEDSMKERYGENYESEIVGPNREAAGTDQEKVEVLADVISMEEYKKKIAEASDQEIAFDYDEETKKSDIVDQTRTHVKIATKNKEGSGEWSNIWIPKNRITPALHKPVAEGQQRTAHINKADDIVVEHPGKSGPPVHVRGEDLEKHVVVKRTDKKERTGEKRADAGDKPATPFQRQLKKQKRHKFVQPEPIEENYRRLYAYLMKTRGLSSSVVDYFVQDLKILYEEKEYHDMVFLGKDKEGRVRYATKRGTLDIYGKKYYGDVAGNDENYGINIVNTDSAELKVFKSAIDLMSYLDMTEDYGSNKLVLGRTADNVLAQFLKDYPQIKRIGFCLDNDEAGKRVLYGDSSEQAVEEAKKRDRGLLEKYRQLGYETYAQMVPEDIGCKDWNEYLVYQKEKKGRGMQAARNKIENKGEHAMAYQKKAGGKNR